MKEREFEQLLWQTRGEHWDFEFVRKPSNPKRDAWGSVFKAIVSAVDIEGQEVQALGVFEEQEGRCHPFVVAILDDPARRDFAGRPIRHFVVLFGDEGQSLDAFDREVPLDFAHTLLQQFADRLQSERVHALSRDEVRRKRAEGPGALEAYLQEQLAAKPLPAATDTTAGVTERGPRTRIATIRAPGAVRGLSAQVPLDRDDRWRSTTPLVIIGAVLAVLLLLDQLRDRE